MYNSQRLQRNFSDAFWMAIELDEQNLYKKIADNFNWDYVLGEFSKFYCSDNGRSTISTRLKIGLLIAKHLQMMSDEKICQQLKENLYIQYLCDISPQDALKGVLDASSLSTFRKQIGNEGIKIIEEAVEELLEKNGKTRGNTMIVDTTIVPENIEYPTDVKLLEKARRKLIKVIDTYSKELNIPKPRTYRRIARKEFLNSIKFRKISKKERTKTQKKMIRFVDRNYKQVKKLLTKVQKIPKKLQEELNTISKMLKQQKILSKGGSVKQRIVSINKADVRPMVKGKYPVNVEFGAKITVIKKGKGLFLGDINTENINDTELLKSSVDLYEGKFKQLPSRLAGDRGFYDTKAINELEQRGIKKVGIAVKKKKKPEYTKQAWYKAINRKRNGIEGDISKLKRCHGLDRNRYKDREQWIRMGFIARNLEVAIC